MGQGAGGNPEALATQAGQFNQITESGRIITLREQAHAGLGQIGQFAWRCPSKIFLTPHTARFVVLPDLGQVRSIDGLMRTVWRVESAAPGRAGPHVVDHSVVGAVCSRVDRAETLRVRGVVQRRLQES